tara:strand:+ start:470 stop:1813 length:1344 start_codon:yes stop_codon:yes gene_type:complete
MKIFIFDPYKSGNFKINKDQAGGYGTSNEIGNNIFSLTLAAFLKKNINYAPMFAIYTFTVLKNKGFDVEYTKSYSDIKSCDLCLVTSSIVCHETEIYYLKKLKEQNIYTGVIGSFCTTLPEPYLQESDFVVSGEPEFFFLNEDVKKIIHEKRSGILKNIDNNKLDNLPYPSWEQTFKYGGPRAFFISLFRKTIPILYTRGCPYSCFHYCTYPTQQGRAVRRRSVENLIGEINFWAKKYNIKNFLFRDPVFSINNKVTLEVCKKIKDSGLKIKFGIETHLNNISLDLAKELYDCGLRYIEVGIESVTDEVITASKRFSIEKEKQISLIKNIEKIGIKIKTMFIYGLPLDNLETCQNSLNFAKKINSSYSQYNIFTPYPGTPIYKEYQKKIISNKYEDFSQSNLVFTHEKLSRQDLSMMISKSYRDYYLRKDYFIKMFKNFFKQISINI